MPEPYDRGHRTPPAPVLQWRMTIQRGLGILLLLTAAAFAAALFVRPPGGRRGVAHAAVPRHARCAAPRGDAGDASTKGKQLYDANCVQCHGTEGKGDGYGAPFLVPPPRDFTGGSVQVPDDRVRPAADRRRSVPHDLARRQRHRHAAVEVPAERRGTVGARRIREELRAALRDRDARSSRCRCRTRRASRAASSRGRDVYAKMQCSKCHGEDGRGVGPSSNDDGRREGAPRQRARLHAARRPTAPAGPSARSSARSRPG